MWDFWPTPSSVKFNNYISALNFKTHLCCCNTPSSEKQKKKEARSRLFNTRVSLAPLVKRVCQNEEKGSLTVVSTFRLVWLAHWLTQPPSLNKHQRMLLKVKNCDVLIAKFVKYVKLCKMCNSLNSGSFGCYPFFIITSSCNWGVHLFQDFPFL